MVTRRTPSRRNESPRRALLGGLLGVGALVLTGCPKRPTMGLQYARLAQFPNPRGIPLEVTMWVKNNYPIDVQIRNVRVSTVIDGRLQLPPIVESPNVWLRSGMRSSVTVHVFIPWNLVPGLLNETLGHTVLTYRVKGVADVTATQAFAIERDDYEVDEEGKVSRAELLAAAALGGIRMR